MNKRIFTVLTAMVMGISMMIAAVNITKVDKVQPTDEIFMDMAVTAATKSVKSGGKPCGAVVILNGAWKGTGLPSGNTTAEENAISRSGLGSLQNATVYTINEPTTQAYNALIVAGADAVFFVNSREDVIAAGIYPADAYDDNAVIDGAENVPMKKMDYADAKSMLKK